MSEGITLSFSFNGYRVYSDPTMLKTEEEIVRLSIWEALTSKPWRPFKRNYTVKKRVASDQVIMSEIDGQKSIIAHPYTVKIISEKIIGGINQSLAIDS